MAWRWNIAIHCWISANFMQPVLRNWWWGIGLFGCCLSPLEYCFSIGHLKWCIIIILYGSSWLIFLGLAYNFGFYGFNPTWWFMSCILVLYLLFPLLFKLCRRYWLFLLVISVGITWIPLYVFNPIKYYLFTFLIGIICVQKGLFDRLFCMSKPVFVRNLLGGVNCWLSALFCSLFAGSFLILSFLIVFLPCFLSWVI